MLAVSEAKFRQWRDSLPDDQKALIDRLSRTNLNLALLLCPPNPQAPGSPDTMICTHEGGHAVAFHALGFLIDHAVARDDSGIVVPIGSKPLASGLEPVSWGVIMLAGDMADGRDPPLTRAEWSSTIDGTRRDTTSDERNAVFFARHLAGGPSASVDAVLQKIILFWNTAVDLFASPGFWQATLAVSSALKRDGRVEGAEIHSICEQHVAFGSLKKLTNKEDHDH